MDICKNDGRATPPRSHEAKHITLTRRLRVMAFGIVWMLTAMLIGLSAATVADACPDLTVVLGLFGALAAALVGRWLESMLEPL
jgi:hypothetical protein